MALQIDRDSTEYVYIGVTGSPPSMGVQIAFLAAGVRPTEPDWSAATIVDDVHALFADAQRSGVAGDYYIARLVGPFGGTGVTLAPGTYQPWIRMEDTTERPIRIAPVAVEVQ